MNKAIAILAVVLLAMVVAVLSVPTFLDWQQYKPELETRISRMLGQPVRLGGSVEFRLVPRPAFTATDVRWGNEPEAASAGRIETQLALWPLIWGTIEPRSVRIVRPEFHLDLDQVSLDGSGFPVQLAPALGSLRSVTVQGGTLHTRTGGEPLSTFRQLNLELSRPAEAQSYQARGDLQLEGKPVTISAEFGPSTGGEAPVNIQFRLPASDASGSLYGRLVSEGEVTRFTGAAELEGPDLGAFAATFGDERAGGVGRTDTAPMRPFQLDARVEAGGGVLRLEEIAADVAGVLARASAVLSRSAEGVRADVEVRIARVDLDRAFGDRAAELSAILPIARGIVASGISGRLDVAADAALFRGGIVKDVAFLASIESGVLSIEKLAADLPGAAEFRAMGEVRSLASAPVFAVDVEAAAGSLRRTLEWAGYPLPDVPPGLVRTASLSATIASDGKTVAASEVSAELDGSKFQGGVTVSLEDRAAFALSARVDRLDLDAYFPELAKAGLLELASDLVAAGHLDALPEALAGFDANVRLHLDRMTVGGVQVDGFVADALLFQGRLDLRELGYELARGTSARLSGRLNDLGTEPNGTLGFRAEAEDVSGAVRETSIPWGILSSGAISVEGTVTGRLPDLRIAGRVEGDRLQAAVDAEVRDATQALRYRASVRGSGGTGGASASERLSFAVTAEGGDQAATLREIRIEQGGSAVTGRGAIDWTGDRPVAQASFTASELDLVELGVVSGGAGKRSLPVQFLALTAWLAEREGTDFAALNAFDAEVSLAAASADLSAQARLQGVELSSSLSRGVLELRQLEGRYAGGRVSATGRLAVRNDPVFTVRMQIDGAETDVLGIASETASLTGGTFDLGLSAGSVVAGDGRLRGEGAFVARNGTLRIAPTVGTDFPQTLELRSLQVPFTLSDDGIASSGLALNSLAGTAEGGVEIDFSAESVSAELRFAEGDLAGTRVRIRGPLDSPAAFVDLPDVR